MATGPEHYCEAERLAKIAEDNMGEDTDVEAFGRGMALIAQAHATLALAAATAMRGGPNGMDPVDFEAWDRVAGVQEPEDDDLDGKLAQWSSHDVSDVMQTFEIHTAPMPGDEPFNEDGGPF